MSTAARSDAEVVEALEQEGAVRPEMPWRRMASFASLPLISLVSSVVIIPIIASVSGATGWAAVALGQALGSGVATVLQYGWGFTGPTLLARMSPAERPRLLWVSILSRLVVAAVLVPVAAVIAAVLAPEGRAFLSAGTVVALSTFGLSAFWYFVATGRAGQAARYETIPRLVVVSVTAVVVVLTRDPIYYPIVFLAGQLLTLGWLTVRLSDVSLSRETWGVAFGVLRNRNQRAGAGTDAVIAVSQAVPTSIMAAVAPGALAVFTAGDRIQKLAQSGIQPLFNAFQGWVSEVPRSQMASRMRLAVVATATTGAIGGALFAIGLPLVDGALFSGQISVRYTVSIPFGVALFLYALTSAINFNVLAPAGRTGAIFRSTVAGGITVVVAISVLPAEFGVAGAAWAVVLAQVAVLCVQLSTYRRRRRGIADGSPHPAAAIPEVDVV
jgi:O-antigen/teichoic acid export membrane protein